MVSCIKQANICKMKNRTASKKLWTTLVAAILFFGAVHAQCPASATVVTTESRCRETGTIKVNVLPVNTYTYEITAGPSLSGVTTSNTFNSLGAGTYEITITKGACAMTVNATVPGTYVDPGLLSATSTTVTCPSGTACLTMATPVNGRNPYRYSVVSGPATRPAQSSPVFCGLPGGDYTIQTLDSCGVVRTTQHTIGVDTGNYYAYVNTWEIVRMSCDDISVRVYGDYYGASNNADRKIKVWYVSPSGDTIKANDFKLISDFGWTALPGYGKSQGTWQVLAYDECGRLRISTFDYYGNHWNWLDMGTRYTNCSNYSWSISNPWYGDLPVRYRVRRCSDNSIVYQDYVTPPTGWGSPGYNLDYDSCYIFEAMNECGDTLNRRETVTRPNLSVDGRAYPGCYSAGNIGNIWCWYDQATATFPLVFTITAGPSNVGDSRSVGAWDGWCEFRDLPFGNYTIVAKDACGKTKTMNINLNSAMSRKVTITQSPHCSGGANVHLKIETTLTNTVGYDIAGTGLWNTNPGYTAANVSFARPGNDPYGLYEGDLLNVMDSIITLQMGDDWQGCPIDTTIAIKRYVAPTLNNVSGFVCNASATGTISYNTLGGLAPFRYRIRPDATNVWSPWQTSAIFTGISPGSYDVNVEDVCPNGSIRSLTFYTWDKTNIDFTAPCATSGQSFTLSAEDKVFGVTYQWYKNNVLVASGDSYTIPSFSTANEGTYKLKQTFQGGMCVDSSSRVLVKCSVLPLSFGELKGQYQNNAAVLNWNTYNDAADMNFVVERSVNATTFTAVGTVNSKGSSSGSSYTFTDNNAPATAFYRIRYADVDSKIFHSNTVRLSKNDVVAEPVIISPVPFKSWVTIQVKASKKGLGSIKFFNMAGAMVINKTVNLNPGNNMW
jgi:hypothetical protein